MHYDMLKLYSKRISTNKADSQLMITKNFDNFYGEVVNVKETIE